MVPPFGLHGSAHELRRECRLFEEALGAREKKTCFEFFPPFFSFTLFLDLCLSSKGERKKTVRNPRFPSLFFCEMRDRRKRALLRARGNKKKWGRRTQTIIKHHHKEKKKRNLSLAFFSCSTFSPSPSPPPLSPSPSLSLHFLQSCASSSSNASSHHVETRTPRLKKEKDPEVSASLTLSAATSADEPAPTLLGSSPIASAISALASPRAYRSRSSATQAYSPESCLSMTCQGPGHSRKRAPE